MGAGPSLQETLLNMRMTSKQLKRLSAKCNSNEAAEKKRAVDAMSKGNLDVARVHAQNAIREKSQSLNFLKLGSRIDGVCSRLEAAVKMNTLTESMKGVVKGMDVALKSMDAEKISKIMDKFEQQFETLDVRTGYMDAAMDSSMASTMPVESVDNLMMEIGSEANLNVADLFASNGLAVPTGKVATGATAAPAGPARAMVALGSTSGGPPPKGPDVPPSGPSGPTGGSGGGGGGGGLPTADPSGDLAARLAALKAK